MLKLAAYCTTRFCVTELNSTVVSPKVVWCAWVDVMAVTDGYKASFKSRRLQSGKTNMFVFAYWSSRHGDRCTWVFQSCSMYLSVVRMKVTPTIAKLCHTCRVELGHAKLCSVRLTFMAGVGHVPLFYSTYPNTSELWPRS